jgi:hypothetical protein
MPPSLSDPSVAVDVHRFYEDLGSDVENWVTNISTAIDKCLPFPLNEQWQMDIDCRAFVRILPEIGGEAAM